ncbi:TolC family protein [Affinibrenneria salicis]|uniref:TolC family protein n=1 Tax=Affinibrenneria salicis TaxID=2590031 RepID=A0A5J5G0K2_9GAMM|nr:TolC family protein [Affinibrenneria salicis]KAA8999883.1 TolC family protein [Affinibrenneria salicis]
MKRYTHRAVGLWPAILLSCWTSFSAAGADLALPQALQAAVGYSADLSANQHQINALQNMADSAAQLPDPQLRFGVENVPLGGGNARRLTREGMTMQRIGIMQTWVSGDKREKKAQTLRAEADSLYSNSDGIVARIQRDTAQAWLNLAFSQRVLQDAEALVQESRRQLVPLQASAAGGGALDGVLDARLTLAAMEDRLSDARRDVQVAQARIAELTGINDAVAAGALPRFERLPADPQTLKRQLHQHPEMQQAQREVSLAQARAAQSSVAAIPDVGVEMYYARRGDEYDDMAGVMISVDLPLFTSSRQDKDHAADLSRTLEARDRIRLTEREHLARLDTLLAQYQAAQSRWRRQHHEVLPLRQQRVTLAVTQYQSGNDTLADVLAARRDLLDARIAAHGAGLELAQLWAALRYLTPAQEYVQ